MIEYDKHPLLKRIIDITVVRTKNDVFFALKNTKLNIIISDWMLKKDMRKYIIDKHREIWFYLIDKLESL